MLGAREIGCPRKIIEVLDYDKLQCDRQCYDCEEDVLLYNPFKYSHLVRPSCVELVEDLRLEVDVSSIYH